MNLDLTTAVLVSGIFSLVFSIAMLIFTIVQGSLKGYYLIASSFFMVTISTLLIPFEEIFPYKIAVVLIYVLLLMFLPVLFTGILRFNENKSYHMVYLYTIGIVGLASVMLFVYYKPSVNMRMISASATLAVQSLISLHYVRSNMDIAYRVQALFLDMSYIFLALFSVTRIVLLFFAKDHLIFADTGLIGISSTIAYEIFVTVSAFLYVWMGTYEIQRGIISQSKYDHLTGILNRENLLKSLQSEYARYLRTNHSLSIAIFDIDHFKNVNDTYGHNCGDMVLVEVSRVANKMIRNMDTLGRYGGEEFMIILPNTNAFDAYDVAERVRKTIEDHGIKYKGHMIRVTASFGICQLKRDLDSVYEYIAKADAALYEAKNSGRNKTMIN